MAQSMDQMQAEEGLRGQQDAAISDGLPVPGVDDSAPQIDCFCRWSR